MIVSLIGFMGCGKSSVGRELSSLLCRPFFDLDKEIESRSGMSISTWFADRGETAFREYELHTLKLLVEKNDNAILAVGGGTPVTPEGAAILKHHTQCVYLETSAVQLKKILSVLDNSGRPLLKTYTVEELLSTRKAIYESTAGYIVKWSDYTEEVPDESDFYRMSLGIRDLLFQ